RSVVSSRSRHTRFSRDWSSDVCSSDLAAVVVVAGAAWLAYYLLVARWHQDTDDAYVQGNVVSIVPQTTGTVIAIDADDGMRVERSEERRGGEAGRSRREPRGQHRQRAQ